MKCHVRCRVCQARRVLPKHPDTYIRPPKCRNCGARSYRRDKWMSERPVRAMTCHCDGYHFPHRAGSLSCKYLPGGASRWPIEHTVTAHPLDRYF